MEILGKENNFLILYTKLTSECFKIKVWANFSLSPLIQSRHYSLFYHLFFFSHLCAAILVFLPSLSHFLFSLSLSLSLSLFYHHLLYLSLLFRLLFLSFVIPLFYAICIILYFRAICTAFSFILSLFRRLPHPLISSQRSRVLFFILLFIFFFFPLSSPHFISFSFKFLIFFSPFFFIFIIIIIPLLNF